MINFRRRLALWPLLLFVVSGCSTIKSWFPDKERDYQFTTEIAELRLPDDLKGGDLAMPPVSAERHAVSENITAPVEAKPATAEASQPVIEKPAPAPAKPDSHQAAPEAKAESVAGVTAASGSSLQIDQPLKQAGHIVSKALSRQQLEITQRNIDKGYFFVKFDPNKVKVEDKSWMDEVNFLFGDEPSQEVEYRIRLQQLNPQLTEVTVQDDSNQPLSTGAANSLLKLITDAINQDVVVPEADKIGNGNGEANSPSQP